MRTLLGSAGRAGWTVGRRDCASPQLSCIIQFPSLWNLVSGSDDRHPGWIADPLGSATPLSCETIPATAKLLGLTPRLCKKLGMIEPRKTLTLIALTCLLGHTLHCHVGCCKTIPAPNSHETHPNPTREPAPSVTLRSRDSQTLNPKNPKNPRNP